LGTFRRRVVMPARGLEQQRRRSWRIGPCLPNSSRGRKQILKASDPQTLSFQRILFVFHLSSRTVSDLSLARYPHRSVQIVLRLYQSPAENFASTPPVARTMVSTFNMTRRSPSYEIRFSRYFQRRFEVYVPAFQRDNINPTVRPTPNQLI
jgi:hypothetical protein